MRVRTRRDWWRLMVLKVRGGAGPVGVDDLTVGDKTQLDERLETVADAQHQAVPVFQQVHGGVPHLRVAEEGGDEFGGAVRLVAAGEAAGDENDLAVPGCLGEAADGVGHAPERTGCSAPGSQAPIRPAERHGRSHIRSWYRGIRGSAPWGPPRRLWEPSGERRGRRARGTSAGSAMVRLG